MDEINLNKSDIAEILDINPLVARSNLGERELSDFQRSHIEELLERYRKEGDRLWGGITKSALRGYALNGYNILGYVNEYKILQEEN